ncbi:MAG: hypothetical protein ABIN97_17550 [Ginsengibacter sp.]
MNTTFLNRNQDLVFTLSFTDAEGDLTDNLYVRKFEPKCAGSNFTQLYKLPEFPTAKNQKGELIVTFDYNDIPPKCFPKNDTCVFKFVLIDKAQNKSDTAVSQTIIIAN